MSLPPLAIPRTVAVLAGMTFLPGLLSVCAADVLQLRFVAASEGDEVGHVETVGLPEPVAMAIEQAQWTPTDWPNLLSVRVARRQDFEPLPMLGSYQMVSGQLRFTPKYGWTPGVTYLAELNTECLKPTAGLSLAAVLRFTVSDLPPTPAARVSAIYPSGASLPENHLRFYLHFSQPMQQGNSYRHLHLYDARGVEIADPFLELGEEMWDRTGRRLTLLIDPGRIKRGLKPREDVGPVFEAGGRYTLVVDRTWKDANRQPLAEEFRKTYRIAPPRRNPARRQTLANPCTCC